MSLQVILSRDSFCALEVDIFEAVCKWIGRNPDANKEAVLSLVRLPLISKEDLLLKVRRAGIVSPDIILDAIECQCKTPDTRLEYRGLLSKLCSQIMIIM